MQSVLSKNFQEVGHMKRTTIKKWLFGALSAILILALIVISLASSKVDKITFERDPASSAAMSKPLAARGVTHRVLLDSEMKTGPAQDQENIINILFLGIDAQKDTSKHRDADCIILVSLNQGTGAVRLVSIDRNIIPETDGWTDEQTFAKAFDSVGAARLTEAVSESFGLSVDGYAYMNYEDFEAVVDKLGGVSIELTEEEAQALNGWNAKVHADSKVAAGVNKLNGHDALEYCRLRMIDSEYGRMERHWTFAKALMNGLKEQNLLEIGAILDVILPAVHTDLTKEDVTALLLNAGLFLSTDISYTSVPETEEGIETAIDFEKEAERISAFLYE